MPKLWRDDDPQMQDYLRKVDAMRAELAPKTRNEACQQLDQLADLIQSAGLSMDLVEIAKRLTIAIESDLFTLTPHRVAQETSGDAATVVTPQPHSIPTAVLARRHVLLGSLRELTAISVEGVAMTANDALSGRTPRIDAARLAKQLRRLARDLRGVDPSLRKERSTSPVSTANHPRGSDTTQNRWSSARTIEPPLRGWKEIHGALGVKDSNARRVALRRLNKQTDGPLRWLGRVVQVNKGELRAWIADVQGQAEEAAARLRLKRSSAKEPGERGGARAQDLGMHVSTRPTGGRNRLRSRGVPRH